MTATAHPSRRRALQRLAAGAATLASPAFAQQGADASTVTVFVGAASAMDWGARLIADQIKEQLGRNAIVVPRLGAGQRLAIGECRRAAPDGRTFVFATNGPFSVNPHIYTKLEYDPDRDFTPVAGISSFDVALSIGPMTGARDFRALMDWARAKGKDAVYGSAPGQGSLSHFVGISLSLATKIPMEHVPYRDSGVGLVDLAAGRLPMMITGLTPQLALHKEGKIRILAVSGDRRSPLVPEVPTMREVGLDFSSSTYTALYGPANLPREIVERFHGALQPMFGNASVLERMAQQAMIPWQVTGAQVAQLNVEERRRFEALAKASGYKPEPA